MCKNMCNSFVSCTLARCFSMCLCACKGHLVCMQWTCFGSITIVFLLVCAPAIYMCSILVPIHLCVSLACAVAICLSGVYLCQLTSAEIVAFIFRFVGKGAYVPVVHVDPRRLAG